MRFLIINARIVSASGLQPAGILINGEVVEAVISESAFLPEGIPLLDARGMLVIPGGIDAHVHLHLPTPAGPSSDDFVSGSMAALMGGTTSLIDFVTPARGESLMNALLARRAEARCALTDMALHVGITWWGDEVAGQMRRCVDGEGVRSFKIYLAYSQTIGLNYQEMRQAMITAASLGALIIVHAEEGEIIERLQREYIKHGNTGPLYHLRSRPPETEIESVKKVINLVRETGCAIYFVHISTVGAARLIADARKEGLPIMAETCIQYLMLDQSVYSKPFNESAKYVISPPLRCRENVEGLWDELSAGVFDVVSTDHCPFNLRGQKDAGRNDFTLIPNGAGGIEYRLQMLYTYGVMKGRLTLQQWIELTSLNAAGIFRLKNKGAIKSGIDADLVFWDTGYCGIVSKATQYQHCDSNIYEGIRVEGCADVVIRRGEILVQNRQLWAEGLSGKFMSLMTSNEDEHVV
ncbi:MAG: dihydropyrimidinase [Bacteroidetes bacterium HGW-Bacteroidetes-22]|nr:MAG: dihydropyrimidinase [Bacteroidetes bacterium HGW-Bacteroidetes-22]